MTLIPDLQRDLVEAAARMNGPRHRLSGALRVSAAAVGAAALGVAAVALLDGEGSERGGARDGRAVTRPPNRTVTGDVTPAPRPTFRPVPGSISEPAAFSFDGVRYRSVGFRNRDGSICTTLTMNKSAPPAGRSCLSARLLRRALSDNRFHVFAGGGGKHTAVTGFAQADVTRIRLVGTRLQNRVLYPSRGVPRPGGASPSASSTYWWPRGGRPNPAAFCPRAAGYRRG
jgi:hypothetical protein